MTEAIEHQHIIKVDLRQGTFEINFNGNENR